MQLVDWVESREARHNGFWWDQMEPYLRRHLPVLAVYGYGDLPAPTTPWNPGAFVGSEEFRNLIAAKVLTAMDVRHGAEDLIDLVQQISEVVRVEAGGV
jgi:hypothetical protein